MQKIKIGSHVKMAGKEMFLGSVKEAESYGANVLMLYTGAPQNTVRKEIGALNIEDGRMPRKRELRRSWFTRRILSIWGIP